MVYDNRSESLLPLMDELEAEEEEEEEEEEEMAHWVQVLLRTRLWE
jgi:hypothetical protein